MILIEYVPSGTGEYVAKFPEPAPAPGMVQSIAATGPGLFTDMEPVVIGVHEMVNVASGAPALIVFGESDEQV